MPVPLMAILGGLATAAFLPSQVKDLVNTFGGDFGGQAGRGARSQFDALAPGMMQEEMGLEGDILRAKSQRAGLLGQELGRSLGGGGANAAQDLSLQMFLRDAVEPMSDRLGRIAAVQPQMDPVSQELAMLGVRF